MNRLQQRLAHLERAALLVGRGIVIVDDGTEDIEVRKARCRAEVGLSDRDIVVIRKRSSRRTQVRLKNRPGRYGRWLASAQGPATNGPGGASHHEGS